MSDQDPRGIDPETESFCTAILVTLAIVGSAVLIAIVAFA